MKKIIYIIIFCKFFTIKPMEIEKNNMEIEKNNNEDIWRTSLHKILKACALKESSLWQTSPLEETFASQAITAYTDYPSTLIVNLEKIVNTIKKETLEDNIKAIERAMTLLEKANITGIDATQFIYALLNSKEMEENINKTIKDTSFTMEEDINKTIKDTSFTMEENINKEIEDTSFIKERKRAAALMRQINTCALPLFYDICNQFFSKKKTEYTIDEFSILLMELLLAPCNNEERKKKKKHST